MPRVEKMSTGVYLEHYIDSLEHLPIELQRNFTLMRDLDTRAQSLMRMIDVKAQELLSAISNDLSDDSREMQVKAIQEHFDKSKEYGDDKVQLAIQTYELVDKHIRRLDTDLQRFEAEIHDRATSTSTVEENTTQKRGRKKIKESKETGKRKGVGSSEEESKIRKKKKVAGAKGGGKSSGAAPLAEAVIPVLAGIAHPADVLDMPVDPNEPTYCLCHQVSYGEMIGCDNSECPIEWFHFSCVGLNMKPKGKWYCPKCTADRKKK